MRNGGGAARSRTRAPVNETPHPAEDPLATWDPPYPPEQAAFPVAGLRQQKSSPPVPPIDSAYGHRNLVCSCDPLDAYADSHA